LRAGGTFRRAAYEILYKFFDEPVFMKTMKVSEARKLFAHALESVVRDDETLIIVRYRKPIAAIVPISRLPGPARTAINRDHDTEGSRRRR
jgi:antitoxin (DNA-binding transcriptional repressor) of toxin-antitoxin stability system